MDDSGQTGSNFDPLQSTQNENSSGSECEEFEKIDREEEITTSVDQNEKGKKLDPEPYLMEEGQDLFINVVDPEKFVLPMETFIVYKVKSRTTRSTFENSEFKVQRRYQDFAWLRLRLEEDQPYHLIPPLPAKFVVKGMVDRFSEAFIKTRCTALNKFLDRISRHPVLSFNDNLKIFLTAEQKEFVAHRKKYEGLMSRVSGSVKSLTTRPTAHDPEFDEVLARMNDFGDQIAVAGRVAERLALEKKELQTELSDFSPTFSAWALKENEAISKIFNSVGSCLELCTNAAEENYKTHESMFIPPLKEYTLYADSIKQVLRRRDLLHSQLDRHHQDLTRKREERENLGRSDQSYSVGALLGRSAAEVREQKGQRLRQTIGEMSLKKEQMDDELEKANANLRADLDRWEAVKLRDMATLFSELGNSHSAYHNECIAAWENILPSLQNNEIS